MADPDPRSSQAFEAIIRVLNQRGWAVTDTAVPAAWWQGLLQQAQALWAEGRFGPGEIGRQNNGPAQPEVRGDDVYWLQPHGPLAQHAFFKWMAQLRQELNLHFNMGLQSQEFHFARYAPGKGYNKHIDQHRGINYRKISIVLYLNPAWDERDGGELCFYEPRHIEQEIIRVPPLGGRLAIFASWLMPHAVLPCKATRWSLTGWLRTDKIADPTSSK